MLRIWSRQISANGDKATWRALELGMPFERMVAITRSIQEPGCALTDASLARRALLTGEVFTMADIPLSCGGHHRFNLPMQRPASACPERRYKTLKSHHATAQAMWLPLT